MAKVIKNGVEMEMDEKDIDRPKEKAKTKGNLQLGRKDRCLLKLIANLTGNNYSALLAQLNAIDSAEPDDSGAN